MIRLLLSALALGTPLLADFDAVAWKYQRLVSASPGINVIRLDRAIYAASRADFSDLRIVRGGVEVPYVIETLAGSYQTREVPVEILDQAVAPGTGLQVTLALGGKERHNRVRLSSERKNFRQQVQVETSDDRRQWLLAREDAYIFDFSPGERRFRSMEIDCPTATRRYLRLTILGWDTPGVITGAFVLHSSGREPIRDLLATATPVRSEDSATQVTVLVLDSGSLGLPVDRLRVEVSTPAFHRGLEIERSDDRQNWLWTSGGVISRVGNSESLIVPVPDHRSRYFRVRIFNRDDRPLEFGNVKLEGLARQVKFEAAASSQYQLYYGNPNARAPQYDLPVLLARREGASDRPLGEHRAEMGPQEANPSYRPPPEPPKPFSERYPALLYGALAAAVIGLGAATIRFMAKIKKG